MQTRPNEGRDFAYLIRGFRKSKFEASTSKLALARSVLPDDHVLGRNAVKIWNHMAEELMQDNDKMSIFVKLAEQPKFPSLKTKMADRALKHNTFVLRKVPGVWPTELATIMGIFKFISF